LREILTFNFTEWAQRKNIIWGCIQLELQYQLAKEK